MGGKVFASPSGNNPALQTPRMNEEIFKRTRDICTQQLQSLFEDVISPAEAPEKIDYGDVDFLVQGPTEHFSWDEVGKRLNARRYQKNGNTHSFAVPLDSDTDTDTYAQVDLHMCRPGFLEWEVFMSSYGDMWQIIGKFLRPMGLTATDKGLHVRIEQIEPSNRKESRLYLTHNPVDVLDFIGLNVEQYQEGFKSIDELYNWCASGRYCFYFAMYSDSANDRQRMKKRSMFQNFIDTWVPENAHILQCKSPVRREEVLRDALTRFGKQEEYDEKVAAWTAKTEEEQLWGEIASILPQEPPGDAKVIIRGLKRWVHFIDQQEGDGRACLAFRTEPELDTTRQPHWSSSLTKGEHCFSSAKETILGWVGTHWQEAKRLEEKRMETEMKRRMQKKNEKKG